MKKSNYFNAEEESTASTTAQKHYGKLEFDESGIIYALRQVGYDYLTAIDEFIDNSIDLNVGTKNIKIDYRYEKQKVTEILVIDDGCGMTEDTLREGLAFGKHTKTDKNCLGCYGFGMKTAALAIGKVLDVYTKVENGNLVHAHFSYDGVQRKEKDAVYFETYPIGSNEYLWFKKLTNSEHGTIIQISELDRLKCKTPSNFSGNVKKHIGEFYHKFISNQSYNFWFKNEKIEPITRSKDAEFLYDEEFSIDDTKFKCHFYYQTNVNVLNTQESGFYIYRNNKLVGKALTLGLFVQHRDATGFLGEIYVDGNSDGIIGTTFNKLVTDKSSKEDGSDSFIANVKRVSEAAKKEISRRQRGLETNSDGINKTVQQVMQGLVNAVNKNNLINANKIGKNNKSDTPKKPVLNPRGPQENPNPVRNRVDRFFDNNIIYKPMGENGLSYEVDGKTIIINTDHNLYKEVLCKFHKDAITVFSILVMSDGLARRSTDYYDDDDCKNGFDNFFTEQSKIIGQIVAGSIAS